MSQDPLEQTVRVALLRDLYGALLTPGQRRVLELAFDGDLSLAEAAELLGVSRQAVHDQIRRAIGQLEGYERALGLLEAERERRVRLRAALDSLEALRAQFEALPLPEGERRGLLARWAESAEAVRRLARPGPAPGVER
ncbi:MAG: YlxM family DNA-binding protein [Bacillota bacterium]|nr:YlxM family DNA-binding protein [Bacillota bacterium]